MVCTSLSCYLDFYPRSPRGERPWKRGCMSWNAKFLSTLPARGATATATYTNKDEGISIHAPREGSDRVELPVPDPCDAISIHAPREGSDPAGPGNGNDWRISIHAPREGSDYRTAVYNTTAELFLSTLPARGATGGGHGHQHPEQHFYPRSPRGERPWARRPGRPTAGNFYPRSPRGERHGADGHTQRLVGFLSTLPARGATVPEPEEVTALDYFYPRSPRGERRTRCLGRCS